MMMNTDSCTFCKIVAKQAPSTILFQDDIVTAFLDIHPVAPVHVLVVPNKHIASVNDVTPEDEPVLGHLFSVVRLIAEQEGISRSGYRLIINSGPNAGQVIFHIHLHVLGGQRMRFPMG